MKLKKVISKFNSYNLLLCLFCLLVIVLAFLSLHKRYGHDEFEAIHTSWKMLQGERIYEDFFQHHHPFLYYLIAPIIMIFKERIITIIAIRIMIFMMLLLIFLGVYLISTKFFNKETAIISLILLSTTIIFVERAVEIRPDVPQTLFGVFSIFFLLCYFENKSGKHLALSSISLGLSFLFLQKAIFLIFFVGILLIVNTLNKNMNYRNLLKYMFVFMATVVPYYIFVVSTCSLSTYYKFNWFINMKFIFHFSTFKFLIESFQDNLLIWTFWILSTLFYLKKPDHKQLGLLSLGLLVSLFFVRTPFPQYFMLSVSLIAILSAHAIYSIFKTKRTMINVLLIVSLSYPSYSLFIKIKNPSNHPQLRKIKYVLSITDHNDFVYDGDIWFNVFRKDIDFFWFSVRPNDGALATYQTFAKYDYNIYELIHKYKPKVISNNFIDNMKDSRISDYYEVSSYYKDLFIRSDRK